MGRIVSLDYGRARIGVAVSDERKIIPSPLGVCKRHTNLRLTFEEIKKMLSPWLPIEQFIVGLPLLLNGKEGEMALEARQFSQELSSFFSIPAVLWDERLSSAQVDRLLKEGNLSRKKRSDKIDAMAAVVILQNYLDRQNYTPPMMR